MIRWQAQRPDLPQGLQALGTERSVSRHDTARRSPYYAFSKAAIVQKHRCVWEKLDAGTAVRPEWIKSTHIGQICTSLQQAEFVDLQNLRFPRAGITRRSRSIGERSSRRSGQSAFRLGRHSRARAGGVSLSAPRQWLGVWREHHEHGCSAGKPRGCSGVSWLTSPSVLL
jgi:hypothetical protein